MRTATLSSSATLLSGALALGVLLTPFVALGAEDTGCLERAIDDRTKELNDVYQAYSDDMEDAVKRLGDDEQRGIDSSDLTFRTTNTSNAMSFFSYQVNEVWRRQTTNLQAAWNRYYSDRRQCGFTDTPVPNTGNYNYNSNYYYNQQRYNYSNNYRTNNTYYDYYNYNAIRPTCSQPVLSAPPAGCNYESAFDSNGCQRWHLACRTPATYSSCGCTPSYDPVCTRDGRTYDNACIAVCSGRDVWFKGICNRR